MEGAALAQQEKYTLERKVLIHPELNLEKWNIFVPTNSRLDYTEVVQKRETTLPDGSRVELKVSVQKVGNFGVLTTQDRKTYCALQKLWEDSGKPTAPVSFSCRKLAAVMNITWGPNTSAAITNSLTRLRTVPMIWDGAFFNAETKEYEALLEPFTILSKLKLLTRKKHGHITKEENQFQFNEYILKNLRANHSKPLYLNVILGFRSEIAQLLYTHIDLILSKTNPYTRNTEGLFTDLGLEGETYRYASARKRKLEKAIKELQGVSLSSGVLEEIRIERNKSKKDYKVIFRKRDYTDEDLNQKTDTAPAPDKQTDTAVQAAEVVRHFHAQLSRPKHRPTKGELKLANELLQQYDLLTVYFIADYTLREAQKTHFDVQSFGAIRQYREAAVAAWQQRQQQQAQAQKVQARQQELLFNTPMPPDIEQFYQQLDEKTKAQIVTRAEQKLAAHKAGMKPEAYAETLRLAILDEAGQVWQERHV